MININEDRLTDDLVTTASELLFNLNSKEFIYDYEQFLVLNESLNSLFNKKIPVSFPLNQVQIDNYLSKKFEKSYGFFLDFIDEYRNNLIDLSTNFNNITQENGIYITPFFSLQNKYSEKDFKDLILSYFAQYNNELYRIVKKYFDEERISAIKQKYDGYAGLFMRLISLKSGYIFVNLNDYTSRSAMFLVHELGHAIDAETFLFKQKKIIPALSNVFVEIPSTSFELGFIDYLKDNHIDEDGATVLTSEKVEIVKESTKELSLALKKEKLEINENGLAYDIEEFNTIDELIEEGTLKHGDIISIEEYNLRDDILYSIGYTIALHLNIIRRNDKNEFLKVLNNITTGRKELNFEQIVELTGFSFEDYISCKHIEPELIEHSMKLKKRFKM